MPDPKAWLLRKGNRFKDALSIDQAEQIGWGFIPIVNPVIIVEQRFRVRLNLDITAVGTADVVSIPPTVPWSEGVPLGEVYEVIHIAGNNATGARGVYNGVLRHIKEGVDYLIGMSAPTLSTTAHMDLLFFKDWAGTYWKPPRPLKIFEGEVLRLDFADTFNASDDVNINAIVEVTKSTWAMDGRSLGA